MAATVAPVGGAPSDLGPARRLDAWAVVRLVLAASLLAVTLLGFLVGEREVDYWELQRAVDAGDVEVVEVSGLLPPGARGSSTVEVRWDTVWGDRVTTIQQVNGRAAIRASRDEPFVDSDPVNYLTQLGVAVRVIPGPAFETGPTYSVAGWTVPGWVGLTGMAIFVAAVVMVACGPQPWRATRWAWFWFVLLGSPIGTLAFLLLSGPPSPTPAAGARRLTGGWAFVLALVLGSFVSTAGALIA